MRGTGAPESLSGEIPPTFFLVDVGDQGGEQANDQQQGVTQSDTANSASTYPLIGK